MRISNYVLPFLTASFGAPFFVAGAETATSSAFRGGSRFPKHPASIRNAASITATQSCYNHGEDIEVLFTAIGSSEETQDYVAIVPTEYAQDAIDGHYTLDMWYSTCGANQDQFCTVDAGSIVFAMEGSHRDKKDQQTSDAWDNLEPGDYTAFLFREQGDLTLAQSPSFTITGHGKTCPCTNSQISTDHTTYQLGQSITVSFHNCIETDDDDWVAIYPAGADPKALNKPISWMWTCGDQFCRGLVPHGTSRFMIPDNVDNDTLPPGSYMAVLARRHHGGPYSAKAVSTVFQVESPQEGQCHDVIKSPKSCFASDEDLIVPIEFTSCVPGEKDWIGIYQESFLQNDIQDERNNGESSSSVTTTTTTTEYNQPKSWMHTCGQHHCTVSIDLNDAPPGVYKALLVHENMAYPSDSKMASVSFTIQPEGGSCSDSSKGRKLLRATNDQP